MRFRCPFCYYIIEADDASRGYPVPCSGCGKEIKVPAGKFDSGCVIGDFVIDSRIGAGSIGTVYRATQLSLNREVALKILSPDYTTRNGVGDFLREARLAAKLSHPNLVQSLAVGEENGVCYLAMICIRGESLKTRLRREGRIPVDEALHIAQQVAEALYYAWDESGLIHRDIKPDNIMISEDGVVKVTDLGLALKQEEMGEKTDVSGSPNYMSPEQFAGGKLDSRSDIYSLGITLYQLISGKTPYSAENLRELALMHRTAIPEPLKSIVPGIPRTVEDLVMKMIEKTPAKRFQSFESVLKAIWTIRQKTAPNKSLVPDVHTISMKHLDYEMQNESSVWKEKTKYQNAVLKSNRTWMKAAGIGACFSALTLVPLTLIVLYPWKKEVPVGTVALAEDVRIFRELASDRTMTDDSKIQRGKKLLASLPGPDGTPNSDYTRAVVELEILRLEKSRLEEQAVRDAGKIRSLQAIRSDMQRETSSLRRKAFAAAAVPKLEKQSAFLRTALANEKESVEKLARERVELLQKTAEEAKRVKKLREKLLQMKTNAIRMRIHHLQEKRLFSVAHTVIAEESKQFPDLGSWLFQKDGENQMLERAWRVLTESGHTFSGKNLADPASRVVRISNGRIAYYDAENVLQNLPWMEISSESAAKLLMNDPLFRNGGFPPKPAFEWLRGHYAAAAEESPEMKHVWNILREETLREIRCSVKSDPKHAKALAEGLLHAMEGVPEQDIFRLKLETEMNLKIR